MDLLKPIVKHATWDLYLRRDGYDVAPYRSPLSASQYAAPELLRELQLSRLRTLLRFAFDSNKFYRRRFDACGFAPGDLRTLEDIVALPILTKDDIRDALSKSFSDGYSVSNSVHKRTGGSTGVPLHNYIDYRAASAKRAAVERHNAWAGWTPGTKVASVWGDTDKPRDWKLRLRNALTDRSVYLDTLMFDDDHIERFLRAVRQYQPSVLMGHAHSAYRLAEYISKVGAYQASFDSVVTTAMVLTPSERSVIERAFHTRVFDRYGCEELSIVASECPAHDGLHVFAEGLLVEILGETPDRPGKLVITDLLNHAMPLIRYEIGDFASSASGSCACGRTLPRLRRIEGRTADFLFRPDRVPVFGISILDTFVIHIAGFKQVQIVQERYDHLHFLIVRDTAYSESSLVALAKSVAQIFGDRMTFDVSFVDSIPLTARGKYRFSICKIPDVSNS